MLTPVNLVQMMQLTDSNTYPSTSALPPDSRDTKTRILAVACDIYLEEGNKGLSMRKVAARAGLSATAIYRHFDSKETLHYQVLTDGFRTFGAYLYPALSADTPMARLNAAADGFFRFATEQSKYYELLFLTMDHSEEKKVQHTLNSEAHRTFDFMVQRVHECMDNGDLKPDDPVEIATLLLSVCNGFFGLYVSRKVEDDLTGMKARYDRMFKRILQGIAR